MNDQCPVPRSVETHQLLEQLQRIAFVVTVGVAFLAGVTWLYTVVVDQNPAWTDTMAGFFSGIVLVGGICMGVLYLVEKFRANAA